MMTAQLLTDLIEAVAETDLSEAPELQRAWDMLNEDDKRWPKEIESEVRHLRALLKESKPTTTNGANHG